MGEKTLHEQMIKGLEMFGKVIGFELRHNWGPTDTIVYVLVNIGVNEKKICGLTMAQELLRGQYTIPLVYIPVCDTVYYLHHTRIKRVTKKTWELKRALEEL